MTPWIIKESGLALTLGVRAITLYPLIFCAEEPPTDLILGHESFHVDQVEEIGIPQYYWDYARQYIDLRRSGHNHREAYHLISYEIEAHQGQYERAKNLPEWAKGC